MGRGGLLLWMAVALLPRLAAGTESLRFVTEEVAPINMAGPGTGEIQGIATEVIGRAMTESRLSYTVSLYAWARSYEMALKNRDTCVFSASRTEERENLFKWVGPLVKDRWVLFGRIDGPAPASVEDARGHSIGGHYDSASSRYLKALGFQVDEVSDFHSNMKRVAARRLDYAVSGLLGGSYAIAHDKELSDVVPVLFLKDIEMYLACNKSVPDRVTDRLNAIIARMTADGTVAAIIRHYQ